MRGVAVTRARAGGAHPPPGAFGVGLLHGRGLSSERGERAGLAVASKLGVCSSPLAFWSTSCEVCTYMCIRNLKLNIFHLAKPQLNATKPRTNTHEEPEKVKAII